MFVRGAAVVEEAMDAVGESESEKTQEKAEEYGAPPFRSTTDGRSHVHVVLANPQATWPRSSKR